MTDRIWLWVYYNKIPIYPIFYPLKGDYTPKRAASSRNENSGLDLLGCGVFGFGDFGVGFRD